MTGTPPRTPTAQDGVPARSSPSAATLHAAIDAFFAEDGPLARRLPRYRPRTAQLEMAHAVAEGLLAPAGRVAVEAGTGTGKSLAYLAAAVLADKRVAVTTGTKALQDQLFSKDVPLAFACAADLLGTTSDVGELAVLMKGRQNYLCKLRHERFRMNPTFAFAHEAAEYVQITRWAEATSTGDRAELSTLPEPYLTWNELDAGAETCVGLKCPHHDACFVVRMRRQADVARLVVANHHLLCADLRVRLETRDAPEGFARVLPDVDAFIVDEAHNLAEVASDHFGVQVSSIAIGRLLGDVRRYADGLAGDDRAALLDAVFLAEDRIAAAFVPFEGAGRERARLRADALSAPSRDAALDALKDLTDAISALPDDTSGSEPKAALRTAERANLLGRVSSAHSDVRFVLTQAVADPGFVVMTEPARRGTVLTAAPVDVAATLEKTLFALDQTVVLTSATLAVARELTPYLNRIGLTPERTIQHVLASPFDAARRAALYCPTHMPEPSHPDYASRFREEALFLLELSQGGALFLFTSVAAMDEGHAALAPQARALGIPIFKQGEMQKNKLLEQLRAHDGDVGAVLCATRSFWEGVDVRGRALRLVVMDRLPFDVPTDPLRQARAQLCRSQGGDPFFDQALPEAALTLKQGAGRLLRDVNDAGIIAVLDGRLRSKGYGRVFLDTLPPLTRIGGRPALTAFWERFVRPCLGLGGIVS